jgi:hypothetical protein
MQPYLPHEQRGLKVLDKTSLSGLKKASLLSLLIILFFSLMSRIDYIVHSILYNYGLRFSYDWANGYWMTYHATFVAFSVIISIVYWMGSKKTACDLKCSLALLLTINLLAIGGLQDILFYVLWAGGLPPTNVVWWWMPWTAVIGTWNSLMQIGFTSVMLCASGFTWWLAIKKQKPH